MKPLDTYVLACVARVNRTTGQGAICSDIVRDLAWEYGRRHEHGTVSKRLSDLRRDGLIAPDGTRVSELTRQAQTVYRPTVAGRIALDRHHHEEASA